ncbi:MAG: pyruvate kinase alpha/beta domain-containing protein [Candidatus Bathyarchaeia archaeon]
MFQDKSVRYFDEPGPQNTLALIEAVKDAVKRLRIEYIVVASESGATALKVAEALKEFKVKVVCVTAYAGLRLAWPESGKWPSITGKVREKLEGLGVKIVEETQYIFKGVTFDAQFLGRAAPSWAIHEFLSRTMGYGFKTALEVALIAAEAGAVPIDKEVVAIAGTGWLGGGADCALIVKPSPIPKCTDVERGLEVREIVAIPRIKFNQKLINNIKEKKETV